MGEEGLTGHTGTDGSTPYSRMDRYGSWNRWAAENISYGSSTAVDVVMQLFVDDGVRSRGHRNNIFSRHGKVTGGYSGSHEKYSYMTCITYAGSYTNNEEQNQPKSEPEESAKSSTESQRQTDKTGETDQNSKESTDNSTNDSRRSRSNSNRASTD